MTVVEWLVIAAVAFLVGTFALDEVRAHYATKQGTADAQHDIENGNFQFRIGGKPRPWYKGTGIAFHELCGAKLIRSFGCCPTSADWSYDAAYNDTMESAIAERLDGFHFNDTYEDAVEEGRKRFDIRLAVQ